MPIRLPFENLIVPVRQIRAQISPSALARHAAAIVFLPLKPSAEDWAALPHGEVLRALYARKVRKEGDCCQLRVGAGAETLLIAVCPAAQASTFERLQSAGEARAQRPGFGARDAADLGAELRPRGRRAGVARDPRSPPSGSLPLCHVQEQTEAAHPARTDRSGSCTQIERSRCDVGHVGRQQPGTLAHGTPAQYLERGGVSPAASRARAPPEAVVPILRGARAEAPRRRRIPRGLAGQWNARRGHRPAGLPAARRGLAGGEPRRERDLLRYRRHQPQGAQRHAGHAHRHGGKRGGRGKPVRPARGGLAASRGLLAGDHRKPDRAAGVQASGRGPRAERHDHPGDPHRCRRAHGARRYALSRREGQARHDHRLRARSPAPASMR